jgi:hypothetical protein
MNVQTFTAKFILGLIFASQTLFAQTQATVSRGQEGSGGIVVACFQNNADYKKVIETLQANREFHLRNDPLSGIDLSTVTVRLFDLYLEDGLVENGTSYIEAPLGESALKILEDRIGFISQHSNMGDRLNFLHQSRINYKKWQKSPAGVAALDDTAARINLDTNCTFLTLAFQDRISGLTTIYFDPRLYNKLSNLEQAALIAHEYLYHDAKLQEMKDSRAVRLIVSALFKKSFGSSLIEVNGFHSDLEAMEFKNLSTLSFQNNYFARFTYDYKGKTLKLENGWLSNRVMDRGQVLAATSRFYKNGILDFGFLASDQELNGLLFKANYLIRMYESGNLMSGTIERDEPNYLPAALEINDFVAFFDSGSLREIKMIGTRIVSGIPCGEEQAETRVYFYENKKFRACKLTNPISYDGFKINRHLEVYPTGKIKSTRISSQTVCFDESREVVDCNKLSIVSEY